MCIDTEWPDSLKNEFTSGMSIKWIPRKMKWKICIPKVLSTTKEIIVIPPRKWPDTPINLRDKQFLLHFFYEWMGYVLRGVQWNWSLSTGFDFDRWWHRENRDISVGAEMMRGTVEIVWKAGRSRSKKNDKRLIYQQRPQRLQHL